jgi:hypothetical protein
MYNRTAVPSNPTGAPLNRAREWLEIIVPEATTNLFLNPSFETNTSNWTASSDGSNGTPYARTTDRQFRGAYSAVLTVRPTGGTYVQIVGPAVVSTTVYSVSFHVRRANRREIRSADVRAVVNGAPVAFDRISYVADGWWRCEKTYTASGTDAPGIRVLGAPGAVFYVDGCQLEAKGYPTTYCDGDQVGLLAVERVPAFQWNGTPHAATSSRSAFTRAGGKPVSVDRYGLAILGLIGLGLSQRSVIATPLGLLDGSLYQRTIREARVFTLAGVFEAVDPRTLSSRRGALRALLSHDRTGDDQPAVLRLQRYQGRDAIGDLTDIPASYLEGLGEDVAQVFDEKVSAQFQQHAPLLSAGASRGDTVPSEESLSIAGLVIRNRDGTWEPTSSGLSGGSPDYRGVIWGPDNKLYVGGGFTSPGTRVARYNLETAAWETLSTGLPSAPAQLLFGPNGNLYASGAFTIAATNSPVAVWNGSAWAALGSLSGITATAIAFGADGTLYAGGFENTNLRARLYSWNGSAWTLILSHGTNSQSIQCMVIDQARQLLYAGGTFQNLNADAAQDRIAVYDIEAAGWAAMGTGLDGTALSLALDQGGGLYVSGTFNNAGGVPAVNGAYWNGQQWAPVPDFDEIGIPSPSSGGNVVFDPSDGSVYFAGDASGVDPLRPSGLVRFTGSTLTNADFLAGGAGINVNAIAVKPDKIALAFLIIETDLDVSGSTTVDNPGTAPTPFVFTINGPSSGSARVFQFANVTTGAAVYLDLLAYTGERIVIDTALGTAISSTRGTLPGDVILSSSDFPGMAFIHGDNTISLLADDNTVTGDLWFIPRYESFDDLTLAPR